MARSSKELLGIKPALRAFLREPDGGVVRALTNTVTFANTTAKTLFTLPANAIVVGITVDVTTAFNSSGTDLLDVGKSGTANHFRDDLNVAAAGQTTTGWSNLGSVGSSPVIVTATYAQSVADAAAGAARVTFHYIDG